MLPDPTPGPSSLTSFDLTKLPKVTVFEGLLTPALKKGNTSADPHPLKDLRAALEEDYSDEACFQPAVMCMDRDEVVAFRISKQSPVVDPSARVEVRCLAMDMDLQDQPWVSNREAGKTFWTELRVAEFQVRYRRLLAADLAPFCLHTTPKGARLIWLFDSPVSTEGYEERYLAWMSKLIDEADIHCDSACKDWTRIFRLPKIVRPEYGQLALQDWFYMEFPDDPFVVDWEDVAPRVGSALSERARFSTEMPDGDHAKKLVWKDIERKQLTPFGQRAKPALSRAFPHAADKVFGNHTTLERGSRDNKLNDLVFQILSAVPNCRPIEAFGMVQHILEAMPRDRGEDWESVVWEKCVRLHGTVLDNKARREAKLLDVYEAIRLKFSVMDPDTPNGVLEHDDKEWCAQRMMLSTDGSRVYVIDRLGDYDEVPVSKDQMLSVVRTRFGKLDPGMSMLSKDELLRCHSVPLMGGELYSSHITKPELRNPNDRLAIALPIHQLDNKLRPEWNDEIHEWLMMLSEDDDRLWKWLAVLPYTELPLVALSLIGPPNCGKSALISAFSELWGHGYADSRALTTDFNDECMQTPLIAADEGFSVPRGQANLVADQFRRVVTDRHFLLHRKRMAKISVEGCRRIVVASNSDHALLELSKNEDLTPEMRRSLLTRILHFRIPEEARVWVEEEKGETFLLDQGWVGRAPNKIARHILALGEAFKDEVHLWAGRNLANGIESELNAAFQNRTDFAANVAAGLAHFINLATEKLLKIGEHQGLPTVFEIDVKQSDPFSLRRRLAGLAFDPVKQKILVVPSLLNALTQEDAKQLPRLVRMRTRTIGDALKNFSQSTVLEGVKNVVGDTFRAEWYELNLESLEMTLQQVGQPCTLVEGWRVTGIQLGGHDGL